MSDGKIIAVITIPAAIIAAVVIAFVQFRNQPATKAPGPTASMVTGTAQPKASPSTDAPKPSPTPEPKNQLVTPPSVSSPTPVPAPPPFPVPAPAKAIAPPTPFRGVKWGEVLAQRPDMRPYSGFQSKTIMVHLDDHRQADIPERHVQAYEKQGDKLKFGNVEVAEILYEAVDGRFYNLHIKDPNPILLAAVFAEVYGQPKELKSGGSTMWLWKADDEQTDITVSYTPPNSFLRYGLSFATITNVKLRQELEVKRKAEAEAELMKAAKDF